MTIITKPPGSVSPPVDLTEESVGTVAIPVNLTEEAQPAVSIPNNLTEESQPAVAIPVALTSESVGTVSIPVNLTEESVGTVAIPNTLTAAVVAALPRTLTPLVQMDFAAGCYAQCGNPRTFDELFTYSRNTSASFINRRVDCNGGYEYFIDTDFVGNVENLVTFSEAFDNAAWTKSNTTESANKTANPIDGAINADLIYPATTGANRSANQALTISNTTDYTTSCFIKSAGFEWCQVLGIEGSAGVWFNVVSGIIGTRGANTIGSIEDVGGGWFRCSVTQTSTSTSGIIQINTSDSDNTATSTTDGTSGIYVWGAQIVVGRSKPYVKTISSAVTETFSESIRQEFDPATGESLGVLIEGASTNLLLRSEEFDNASWTKSNSIISANDIESPDGTTSADKLSVQTTATNSAVMFQAFTSVASSNYTFSFFVKASEVSFVQIYFGDAHVTSNPRVNFDIAAGTIGSQDGNIDSASMQKVGDFYRVSATVEAVGTTLTPFISLIQSATDTRAQSNSWTAGDGLYIWGAQCELQPFATSYIYTTSGTVSRAADDLDVSPSNMPDYRSEFAVNYEIDVLSVIGSDRYIFDVGSSGGVGRHSRISATGTTIGGDGPSSTTLIGEVIAPNELTVQTITREDNNSVTRWYLGSSPQGSVSVSGSNSGWPEFSIGANASSTTQLFGHIKTMSVYDKALTDQEVSLL